MTVKLSIEIEYENFGSECFMAARMTGRAWEHRGNTPQTEKFCIALLYHRIINLDVYMH